MKFDKKNSATAVFEGRKRRGGRGGQGAEEDEGDEGAEEAEGADGADGADRTDVASIYIYIVIWLGHHGNRLYGSMGLWGKMLGGWMEWMDSSAGTRQLNNWRLIEYLK